MLGRKNDMMNGSGFTHVVGRYGSTHSGVDVFILFHHPELKSSGLTICLALWAYFNTLTSPGYFNILHATGL